MSLFNNKQYGLIAAIVLVSAVLAVLILREEKPAMPDEHGHAANENMSQETAPHDEHAHEVQAPEIRKGPHGGKIFEQDGYAVEVTIYEQDVPPEFRVYAYQNGKALAPADFGINIRLERLGASPQDIVFAPENDYLKGNAVVEEPHSFDVKITSKHAQKTYQFAYEQVEARVQMSDKQLVMNGIEVLTAGPAIIKSTLNLQGEIKFNADKTVQIVPRVGGIVEAVFANAGDKVRQGQVLAAISSQSIADMRSELLATQQRVTLARSTYEREKQLWEDKISAQQDYLQAEHDLREAEINAQRIRQKLSAIGSSGAGKGLARYEIRSPINGVVTDKQLSQGQVVSEADSIYQVADLSSVWAEMVIYTKDVSTVKIGQSVTVKAAALDKEATGTVAYVSALVGAQTRTAMARVVLDNRDNAWLPGLPVNVALVADEITVPLAVSVEGIQTIRDWTAVFGRYGEYFEARPLELGRRDDKYVEVLKGLNKGDKYAAGNSFLIKADIGKAGASHDH